MYEVDFQDVKELQDLGELIEKSTAVLTALIKEEATLEIALLGEIRKYPEIAQSLSISNKIKSLKLKTKDDAVGLMVDEWIRATANIRSEELCLRQLEGKRDSLKKIMSLYKERNV